MEINTIKIKGAEKACKSLPTYCSNYLPLFWKNVEVDISQVFNQSIESLHVLISMIRDYNMNKHRARVQITALTETCNLKHEAIVLGISSYYPQKYMSGTPLKCQKRWGFRGVRPPDPHQGVLPPGPPPGAPPPDPPSQIKMKWCPWLIRKWSCVDQGVFFVFVFVCFFVFGWLFVFWQMSGIRLYFPISYSTDV